jgi:hypothetical protein
MSALQLIIKEAKSLKKSFPKRFTKWTDYVKQASAIYASKHGGKSPVGKKKAVKKVAVKKAAKKKVIKKIAGSSDYYTRKKEGRVIPRKSTKKTTKTVLRSPLKKKAVKKPISTHKDTKSHNVNIRVISGIGSKMMARISPVGYVYASNITYGRGNSLRDFLKENSGKWIEIDTKHLFNNQYNTESGYRIYDTMIDAIKNDARKKGVGYGVNGEIEDIAFLEWKGIKPHIIDIPKKKFGTYEFESMLGLNYYRLRNSRQKIDFIYYDGKYFISNGIGYKMRSKITSTYSGSTIPDKVKNDLDKYLKSYR